MPWGEGPGSESQRIWLFSPAAATGLFFLLRIFLAVQGESDPRAHSAAVADAPATRPVRVRVVARIQAETGLLQRAERVPTSEAALFELMRRDGAVVFDADDVDVLETDATTFDAERVFADRPGTKLRRATLGDPSSALSGESSSFLPAE